VISTFFENYVWTLVAMMGVGFVIAGNIVVLWSGQRARA
jgi:hypothetical protein